MALETMTKGKRGGARRKPTGNVWKHTTMTIKPSIWDKIKKVSAVETDNTSRWAIKKVAEYEGIPPVTDIGNGERSIICPLCFTEVELRMLKEKAEQAGMSKSQYFVNVLVDCINRGV